MISFSCGMWDLVPWQGLNLGLLHWECGGLTTGLSRKSPRIEILIWISKGTKVWAEDSLASSLSLSFCICLGLALCLTHIGYLTFVKLTYHWRHMENLKKKKIIIIQHVWVPAEREETVKRDLVPYFKGFRMPCVGVSPVSSGQEGQKRCSRDTRSCEMCGFENTALG